VRTLAPSLAAAPFLAACALLDGPLAPGEIGLTAEDILAGERESLETAHSHGRRMEMAQVSSVENLHCIRQPYGRETPNCRYRLRYRKADGSSGALKRRNQFFKRADDGRWESVIIVRGD
jgi:hypothetical protein